MNERDPETFARFARRFAQIEAEVKDLPPFDGARRGATVRLRPSRHSISPAIAVLALVVAVAALAPLIAGGPIAPPTSSFPVVVGGSSAPPLSTPSPAPTEVALVPLDPASPPDELAGPCSSVVRIAYRAATTIEQDAARSSAVVIGTVTGVGKAQWNTPGGRAPNGPNVGPSLVMRLLRVDVETVVRGSTTTVITVWIPGGVIGCHGFYNYGFGDPQVGSRYVFFLDGKMPRTTLEGVVGAWQMWSVEGDRVVTSFEGRVPLATLIERAANPR